MLTGVHVAILGGDQRYLELIKKCSELDATISLMGYELKHVNLPGVTHQSLQCDTLQDADALILPIIGLNEQGQAESSFADQPLQLQRALIECLPEDCHIYTGMANETLKKMCAGTGVELICLLDRDDVAIYNSIPTAEGTVMMAMENTKVTIHDSQVMVIGFGRVGMSVARLFQAMGAHVRVAVQHSKERARIFELGMQPADSAYLKEIVSDCDILINTVPLRIVTAEVISCLPQTAYIIDLASAPGGTDFRFAQRRGIKASLAPGLPGIVAPVTAGKILANVVTRLIMEQVNNRRDKHEFER